MSATEPQTQSIVELNSTADKRWCIAPDVIKQLIAQDLGIQSTDLDIEFNIVSSYTNNIKSPANLVNEIRSITITHNPKS